MNYGGINLNYLNCQIRVKKNAMQNKIKVHIRCGVRPATHTCLSQHILTMNLLPLFI